MGQPPSGIGQDARYAAAAKAYGSAMARLARGYEADPALRQDLVQEIHAALWRSFAYFEGQCSERSWVYRVAHNVAVSHLIARRRLRAESYCGLEEMESLPDRGDLEAETGERRVVERLLATIHRLPPADRQVILLYLEDMSAAEIGDVTGLSANAVALRIYRIKSLLARKFGAQGGEA
jgi:RNA polymerase sigma factor (sigma-70 family)